MRRSQFCSLALTRYYGHTSDYNFSSFMRLFLHLRSKLTTLDFDQLNMFRSSSPKAYQEIIKKQSPIQDLNIKHLWLTPCIDILDTHIQLSLVATHLQNPVSIMRSAILQAKYEPVGQNMWRPMNYGKLSIVKHETITIKMGSIKGLPVMSPLMMGHKRS